jgi:hypothetical protein
MNTTDLSTFFDMFVPAAKANASYSTVSGIQVNKAN